MKIFRILRWLYKKLQIRKLRYALPFVVLAAYTIIGAYFFRHFEFEPDERRRKIYRRNTEYAFKEVINKILEIFCNKNFSCQNKEKDIQLARKSIYWFLDYLNLTQIIEERSESSPWTWPGAMFYAGQLYTTIGYGLPTAYTAEGRLASILYIMIGIPIFLLILAQVGKLLSRTLRKFYKRVHHAKMKIPNEMSRKMSEPVKAIYKFSPLFSSKNSNCDNGKLRKSLDTIKKNSIELNNDYDESENNNDTKSLIVCESYNSINDKKKNEPIKNNTEKFQNKKTESFPIPLALTILILWIAFSAAMFCLWETEWGYLTSVYFFFVSISTVGLGDIVPTKPDMMFINFILILIGLALLSMCINLIQAALEKLIVQLVEEYINEIEKIAKVITNDKDFIEEEAPAPFEVSMTAEMLTVPLTTIAHQSNESSGNKIWRSAKDWMADQIASYVLVNRIDPFYTSSDSSDNDEDDMFEVVVSSNLDKKSQLSKIDILKNGESTNARVSSINKNDLLSRDSSSTIKKSHSKHSFYSPFTFSRSTMRAVQAIEIAKMQTYRNANFKSRLFAKFATNKRLTRFADNQMKQEGSFSKSNTNTKISNCQTSTPQTINEKHKCQTDLVPQRCILGSIDTTSSELQTNNNDWTSNSILDDDSLCSVVYFDVNFNNYKTDSVLSLMRDTNTPVPSKKSISKKKECFKHNNLLFVSKTNDNKAISTIVSPIKQRNTSCVFLKTEFNSASVPGSPPVTKQNITNFSTGFCNQPTDCLLNYLPNTTNLICNNDQKTNHYLLNLPFSPTPTTPKTSPITLRKISHSSNKNFAHLKPLLASTPLHHRLLSNRRCSSDNNCLIHRNLIRNNLSQIQTNQQNENVTNDKLLYFLKSKKLKSLNNAPQASFDDSICSENNLQNNNNYKNSNIKNSMKASDVINNINSKNLLSNKLKNQKNDKSIIQEILNEILEKII